VIRDAAAKIQGTLYDELAPVVLDEVQTNSRRSQTRRITWRIGMRKCAT
jgi:hypothetical protein